MRWFALFFFVSGAASLIDEVVWLRLAMAAFGVTAPLVAIVLSLFMGGLALGSWLAARGVARAPGAAAAAAAYAAAEVAIGLSAWVVPAGLERARSAMSGPELAWGSGLHYLAAAAWLAPLILPFAAAMGATFPLAMAALRARDPAGSERAFSALYLGNVLGAAAGTLAAAMVLIELLGFRRTLFVAAAMNGALAVAAAALAARWRRRASPVARLAVEPPAAAADPRGVRRRTAPLLPALAPGAHRTAAPAAGATVPPAWLLFATGGASMGIEVVWVRQYTPLLGTVVYAFAAILATYLIATAAGTLLYRRASAAGAAPPWPAVASVAGLLAVLAAVATDPRLPEAANGWDALARLGLGIAPVCAAVGFLTPLLVERRARGDPSRAGRAYALDVAGCIAGPPLAGFVLLPLLGERLSLLALAVPLLAAGALAPRPAPARRPAALAAPALALAVVLGARDHETRFPGGRARRDHEATVVAAGAGMERRLYVNGVGMTHLTPITKMMVHLPLAYLPRPPRNALVVCFGMGTSFRSATAWGIPCTAVELIPSVPELFGYYHADAAAVARRPGARIVVDDGRRFLARTAGRYDLITVDPPPPVEAATSSLLYSREFYALAAARLAPDGIVAAWFPGGEPAILGAVARTLAASFPHVRAFVSVEGWGVHLLGSRRPLPERSAAELAARLPPGAAADLLEWMPGRSVAEPFAAMLAGEIPIARLVALAPGVPELTDDRPVNEYFLLRRLRGSVR